MLNLLLSLLRYEQWLLYDLDRLVRGGGRRIWKEHMVEELVLLVTNDTEISIGPSKLTKKST